MRFRYRRISEGPRLVGLAIERSGRVGLLYRDWLGEPGNVRSAPADPPFDITLDNLTSDHLPAQAREKYPDAALSTDIDLSDDLSTGRSPEDVKAFYGWWRAMFNE